MCANTLKWFPLNFFSPTFSESLCFSFHNNIDYILESNTTLFFLQHLIIEKETIYNHER